MSCLHPVKVEKEGSIVYYPCGKCVACRNSKSHLLEQLARVESSKHKYTIFSTLTYAPEHLPTVEVVVGNSTIGDGHLVSIVSVTDRITEYLQDDLVSETYVPSDRIGKYMLPVTRNKFHIFDNNQFGILFYRDVQLFHKRLRRNLEIEYITEYKQQHNIKRLSYEKKKDLLRTMPRYRFLTVGEYGPKTFRPHYHICFYTDSDWLQSALLRLVDEVWSYGITRTELSDGQANSYTAGYLTSTCNLPPLIADIPQRFCVHSTSFGFTSFKELGKDIRDVRYEDLISRSLVYSGRLHQLRLPSALESSLFPKTFGFGDANHIKNLRRYQSYRFLSRYFRTESVTEIVDRYLGFYEINDKLEYPTYRSSRALDMFSPFNLLGDHEDVLSDLRVHDGIENRIFDLDIYWSRLSSVLYKSKRFLLNCERFNISPDEYYKVIWNYYKDKDMYLLKDSLSQQQLVNDPPSLLYFYSNIPHEEIGDLDIIYERILNNFLSPEFVDDNQETLWEYVAHPDHNPLYRGDAEQSEMLASNKMKHKIINDANKIFLY